MTTSFEMDLWEAWRSLSKGVERLGPTPSPESLAAAWSASDAQLRETFATHAGRDEIAARFHVPEDYATFMCVIGGGWKWELEWVRIWDAREVAERTCFSCKVFEQEWAERGKVDGFWLEIGRSGDNHDRLLCCDLGHPLFGVIAEAEDYHPWMAGISSLWFLGANFRDFLRGEDTLFKRSQSPIPITDWLQRHRGNQRGQVRFHEQQ